MGSRRDTWLLFALMGIILLLAALATRVDEEAGPRDARASSYFFSPPGTRALYETLRELNVPVTRRTEPYVDAGALQRVTVLVAPGESPSPAEVAAILETVRGGGTLVFAMSWTGAGPLYDSLGVYPDFLEPEGMTVPTDWAGVAARPAPHRFTQGVREVKYVRAVFADSSGALKRPGVQRLLSAQARAAALAWPEGRGTVVVFADAQPLSNEYLQTSGAAPVFARAAAEGAGADGKVEFNEWYHGFRGDGSPVRGLLAFLTTHPGGKATLQLFGVLCLLVLVGARRFGAPLPPPPARRRSPLEHVEALAGAYGKAGARRTARRLLAAGLARRLGKRAPGDEAGASELVTRLAKGSPVAQDAAAALETEWKRGPDADLVSVARAMDRLLDEVRRP